MKRYILFPEIVLLIFLSLFPLFLDCTNRKPLAELAKISPEDVPFVVSVEPAEGTYWVPENTQLSVLFSHPMDGGSIKDAIKIYYEGLELYGSSMIFEWNSNARQCKINPQLTFPLNAKITATIDTTVKSKDGIPMKKPFTWSFKISAKTQTGEPTAIPVCPARENDILTLNRAIEIEFDRQMLRSSVEGSFLLSSEGSGDIRTGEDGDFTWTDTNYGTTRMTFIPHTPLLYDQYYTVRLPGKTCSDLAGNLMKSGFEVRFYTIDSVIYVSGTDGSDSNEGYHRMAPVQTINKGIEKAKQYGYNLIKIEGGRTYEEDISSDNGLYSGLYLQGGWDRDFINTKSDPVKYPTILKPYKNNFALSFKGLSKCTIDGLNIYGPINSGENKIGAVYIGERSSNITIKNCVLYGTDESVIADVYGIYSNASFFNVIDTKIYGSDNDDIVTGNLYGVYTEKSSFTIQDSCIYGAGGSTNGNVYGIRVSLSSLNFKTSMVDLYSGSASGNSIAIKLEGASNTNIENNNNISGGISNGNLSAGIYIESSENILIKDNATIYGGETSSGNTTSYGIYANNTTGLTISGNANISGGKGTASNYGVYIDQGNSDIKISNNNIVGGSISASGESAGVYVNNSTVTISGNSIIGNDTGYSPITAGIHITGNTGNVIIEDNQVIKGGTNGIGTVHGILVQNVNDNATLIIQDNSLITGGSTDSGDTYGIRLINVEKAKIFRNVIIGGEISNNSGSNYGISFENEVINNEYNSVFNNFIVGGKQSTNNGNPCYGVYISKSKIKLLNNTIDAGGSISSTTNTYGIYVGTTLPWEIDQIIIVNNYMIGGNGNISYGIYLEDDEDLNGEGLKCVIYKNIFNTYDLYSIVSTTSIDIKKISKLDEIGTSIFEPDPEGNLEETYSPATIFENFENNDYHIASTNSVAKNNGHNGSYNSIYSEEGAMFDIDGEPRPYDEYSGYSKIDLGADEFGD